VIRLVVDGNTYGPQEERLIDQGFRARLGEKISLRYEYVTHIPHESNGKYLIVKNRIAQEID